MSMIQINLFGETVAITSKAEKTSTKKQQESKKPVPVKEKKLPKNKTLLVCYAREQFEYTLEERAELQRQAEVQKVDELEIIRRELARYFPELSAERVTWHWVDDSKEKEAAEVDESVQTEEIENADELEEKLIELASTAEENNDPAEHIVVVPIVTAGKKGQC